MGLPWKNGRVAGMDYIRFGKGTEHLLILPGLGDGLQTVKGTALPMSLMYRIFGREYTVWSFSRKNDLTPGYTTREMAADVAVAMDKLQIPKADVLGVSMGGMIAQYLAIDHPRLVGKLVLAVTAAEPNPILEDSVREWLDYARGGDHTGLMDSNLRRIYSRDYYRKNKWMVPMLGKLTKPKSYDRFYVQAQACLQHNAQGEVAKIGAPTLVIGGEQDIALGADASRTLAEAIPNARLKMYDAWGHGLYEEAKDFNSVVLAFLQE